MSTTPRAAGPPSLRLLERAARAVDDCATLADAAQVVIADACEAAGWPVGLLAVMTAAGSPGPPTV